MIELEILTMILELCLEMEWITWQDIYEVFAIFSFLLGFVVIYTYLEDKEKW